MKPSVWNILTGFVALALVVLACAFTQIFFNPTSNLNPFPPPTAVAPVVIVVPSATQTQIQPLRTLPATWTLTPTSAGTATSMVLKPSSTIPATPTLYIAPTGTNTPTVTRTPAPTRADARCQLIDESPKDDTEFTGGQEFTKSWNMRNNSGETWRSDIVDIRYFSGTRMHLGADAYDLPRDIAHRDSYEFSVRMRAPTSPGTYKAVWSFVAGDKSVCNFSVQIIVK
jgi:hypothetical protein